jgi:hypothetical protein
VVTLYWTCTRQGRRPPYLPFEHRRLNVSEGDAKLSSQMWRIWRRMTLNRKADQTVTVRLWEGDQLLYERVSDDHEYPRSAVRAVQQARAARKAREVRAAT